MVWLHVSDALCDAPGDACFSLIFIWQQFFRQKAAWQVRETTALLSKCLRYEQYGACMQQ